MIYLARYWDNWFGPLSGSTCKTRGFCDASLRAYRAKVYGYMC